MDPWIYGSTHPLCRSPFLRGRLEIVLLLFFSRNFKPEKDEEPIVIESQKIEENQKYGLFVGGEVNKMKLELGAPSEDIINDTGNEVLIYKTKKYGVPCERRFEVNAGGTIIAFSSSGCF